MTQRSTHPATFAIDRTFDAPPETLFNAFADPATKARWFEGPDEWTKGPREFDFRVGGHERTSGGPPGGQVHAFHACYQDIIPNQRIVYSYDMHLDDKRISVSLTTVEFKPAGTGTRLTFTEQGVFLDGYDDAGSRESGTRWLLDKMDAATQRQHPTKKANRQ